MQARLSRGSSLSLRNDWVCNPSRYYILAFPAHQEPEGTRQTCAAVLEKAKLDNWAMGKTKASTRLQSCFKARNM